MNQKKHKKYSLDISIFESIDLNFLENLNLLDRFDTKFVVNFNSLNQLLFELKNDFYILEINNFRIFNYTSVYYDDNAYFFYYQHHNNAANRLKIRNRFYHETEKLFFEIKQKLTSQKTIKFRKLTNESNIVENFINDKSYDNLKEIKNLDLVEKLIIKYKRITLISKDLNEKITIDIDLEFENSANSILDNNSLYKFSNEIQLKDNILPNICVIEVKQIKAHYNTNIFQLLRNLNYKADISFSKYCIGLILTGENVKYNLFKPTLLQIEKVAKNY